MKQKKNEHVQKDDQKDAESQAYKPFKWKTSGDLAAALKAYFADPAEVPWTISGLAYYLGTTRCVLLDYQGRNGYGHLVTAAKAKIEASIERLLIKEKSGVQAAGIIFNLANNYNRWYQRQEVKTSGDLHHSGNIGVSINWVGGDASSFTQSTNR